MYTPLSRRRYVEGGGVSEKKVQAPIKGFFSTRAVQTDKERKAYTCTAYELSVRWGECVGSDEAQESQVSQMSSDKCAVLAHVRHIRDASCLTVIF